MYAHLGRDYQIIQAVDLPDGSRIEHLKPVVKMYDEFWYLYPPETIAEGYFNQVRVDLLQSLLDFMNHGFEEVEGEIKFQQVVKVYGSVTGLLGIGASLTNWRKSGFSIDNSYPSYIDRSKAQSITRCGILAAVYGLNITENRARNLFAGLNGHTALSDCISNLDHYILRVQLGCRKGENGNGLR